VPGVFVIRSCQPSPLDPTCRMSLIRHIAPGRPVFFKRTPDIMRRLGLAARTSPAVGQTGPPEASKSYTARLFINEI